MPTETDLAKLDVFAKALRESPKRAGKAAATALQAGAEKARELGTEAISKRYFLEKPYIQKHLAVNKKATVGDLFTRISAQYRQSLAPRYGADQALEQTRTKRVKGDPYRKIPKGLKAAGSTPWAVKRGSSRRAWSNAFFIWGRNSGAWIMAVRENKSDPKSKPKAIHSLSVSQAWKGVREKVAPAAMKVTVDTFIKEFKKG